MQNVYLKFKDLSVKPHLLRYAHPSQSSLTHQSTQLARGSQALHTKTLRIDLCLIMIFISLSLLLPASAINYEELRNFMLAGDVEAVIAKVELNEKTAFRLNEDEAELYIKSLLIMGEVPSADSKLDYYLDKYPKSSVLTTLKKEILFYSANFESAKKYKLDDYEKTQYKLMELLDSYLVDLRLFKIKNPKYLEQIFISNTDLDSSLRSQRKKIIKEASKLHGNRAYFRGRFDYLLELKDPETNKLIEKEALKLIVDKRKDLFPKTLDFYELALAYKTLAILSIQAGDERAAKNFIKLGQASILKMRSIWLIEDIIVERPIMKTTEHSSKFGCLIPQWIMALREEYDSYLH